MGQYRAFIAESVEIDERNTKLRAFKREKSLTRDLEKKRVQKLKTLVKQIPYTCLVKSRDVTHGRKQWQGNCDNV